MIDSDPRDSRADRTAIAGTSDRTWTTREGLRGALSGQRGASESRASGATTGTIPDPTLPHGSTSTYSRHRCRCTDCRIAWARYARQRRAARRDEIKADPGRVQHGSVSTYSNYRCRCDECRAAWRQAHLVSNANRAARLAADPSAAPHGRASTYGNWGCRCDECRAAFTDDCRRRRRTAP